VLTVEGYVLIFPVIYGALLSGYAIGIFLGGRENINAVLYILLLASLVVLVSLLVRSIYVACRLEVPLNYSGFLSNRNFFSFQVLVCASLAIGYWWHLGRIGKLSLFVLIVGALFTSSRAGYVSLVVLVGVACLFDMVNKRELAAIVMSALVVLFLFGLAPKTSLFDRIVSGCFSRFTTGASVSSRVDDGVYNKSLLSPISTPQSDNERILMYKEAVKMWLSRPIFGWGWGGFNAVQKESFGHSVSIHNTLLMILVEFGVIGFLVIAGILCLMLKSIFWKKSWCFSAQDRSLLTVMSVSFSFSLLHNVFFWITLWVVLGILLAVPGDERVLSYVDS